MKRSVLTLVLICVFAVASVTAVSAARNPSGTGQPTQSCGAAGATSAPAGFSTGGFANAEQKYAGSGKSADHANSSHAVSQYDVACFQQTQNGH